MQALAAALGFLLVLAGGLFALQGLGIVMWPSDSFMLADKTWALYGGVMAVIGLLLILWSRARRA
ncbi:hypothetical protein GCM10011515_10880 [Tsuneonella deserti]|uniref:Uncharacterized protein n=1 Tax=Tsuneonella deserti TaxID=2035528 RepID=A0ABQ1S412_9SPHN|nr:hypothetical protein [Tsuneonella deserti]GGD92970.1 hypothetical protein GCM10011515_10880 [Tsuneonella deserti]